MEQVKQILDGSLLWRPGDRSVPVVWPAVAAAAAWCTGSSTRPAGGRGVGEQHLLQALVPGPAGAVPAVSSRCIWTGCLQAASSQSLVLVRPAGGAGPLPAHHGGAGAGRPSAMPAWPCRPGAGPAPAAGLLPRQPVYSCCTPPSIWRGTCLLRRPASQPVPGLLQVAFILFAVVLLEQRRLQPAASWTP